MRRRRKLNLPKGAELVGNGPESTVFCWHGKMYRFAQGRRGGTIYVAHALVSGIIMKAFWRREARRRLR
jgi:hypothetical protein